MSALKAAETVLVDEGKPLDYREITRRIIARGLWKTRGSTRRRRLILNSRWISGIMAQSLPFSALRQACTRSVRGAVRASTG